MAADQHGGEGFEERKTKEEEEEQATIWQAFCSMAQIAENGEGFWGERDAKTPPKNKNTAIICIFLLNKVYFFAF